MRVRPMVTAAVLAGLVAACGLPGGGGGTLITHNEAPDTGSNNSESTPEEVLRWPARIIGGFTDTDSTEPVDAYDIDYYVINRAVPAGTTLRLSCTSAPDDPYAVHLYSLSAALGGHVDCNGPSVDNTTNQTLPIGDLYMLIQTHTFQASGGYLTVPGSYTVTITEV